LESNQLSWASASRSNLALQAYYFFKKSNTCGASVSAGPALCLIPIDKMLNTIIINRDNAAGRVYFTTDISTF